MVKIFETYQFLFYLKFSKVINYFTRQNIRSLYFIRETKVSGFNALMTDILSISLEFDRLSTLYPRPISVSERPLHPNVIPVRRLQRLRGRLRRKKLYGHRLSGQQISLSEGYSRKAALHQQVTTLQWGKGLRRWHRRGSGLLSVSNLFLDSTILKKFIFNCKNNSFLQPFICAIL